MKTVSRKERKIFLVIGWNACIMLLGFLLFLFVFEDKWHIPQFFEVMGRMHPMVLHFPITLITLCLFADFFFRKKTFYTEVRSPLLLSTAIITILTAIFGMFLGREDYSGDVLNWHKRIGVLLSLSAAIYYAFRNLWKENHVLQKLMSIALFAALIITGHLGAELTHGKNFVLEPLKMERESEIISENRTIYEAFINPILEAKCMSCHNDNKSKGGLNMSTFEKFSLGGENGKPWQDGDPEESLIIKMINLPHEDTKHMPPLNEPQLHQDEILLISNWIESVGNNSLTFAQLEEGSTLKYLLEPLLVGQQVKNYDHLPEITDGEISKLNRDYVNVSRRSKDNNALSVSFFNPLFFSMDEIKKLLDIKDNIVELSLNKMPLTNQDLEVLAKFSNLENLSLSGTGLNSEADFTQLKELTRLEELVLSENEIEDQDIEELSSLENLKNLKLWNTLVTENFISSYSGKVQLFDGMNFIDSELPLPKPESSRKSIVFQDTAILNLRHAFANVDIYYTTDAEEPTKSSKKYDQPIVVEENKIIRAKAFLEGWQPSETAEFKLIKGLSENQSIQLKFQPDSLYRPKTNDILFDGLLGHLNYESGSFFAFRENSLHLDMEFAVIRTFSAISVSHLVNSDASFYPSRIRIFIENDKGEMILIKDEKFEFKSKYDDILTKMYTVKLPATKSRYLRLIVDPVDPLPEWHKGAGEKGWIFIDEVFVE